MKTPTGEPLSRDIGCHPNRCPRAALARATQRPCPGPPLEVLVIPRKFHVLLYSQGE